MLRVASQEKTKWTVNRGLKSEKLGVENDKRLKQHLWTREKQKGCHRDQVNIKREKYREPNFVQEPKLLKFLETLD